MLDRIKKHLEERDAINEELTKIMGYCDESHIDLDFIDKKWAICCDIELHLQVDGYDIDDNYFVWTISSMGMKNQNQYIGNKDGYTYVMAFDGSWDNTRIFILNNKLKQE